MAGAEAALTTQASKPATAISADMNALLATVGATRDQSAFARLYAFFAPRVKAYVMRLGSGAGEAEDLTQEVLSKVWRKANLFDAEKASASTWIFTIARNQRIDAARRAARPVLDPAEPMLLPEEDPRADIDIERREREAKVRAVFERLPPNQRAVVALHFYEDHAHSAIAERLGLPLGTVKSRLRLAFARIRRELGEDT